MAKQILFLASAIGLMLSGSVCAQPTNEENPSPSSSNLSSELSIESLTFTPYSRVRSGGLVSVRCTVGNSGKQRAVGYLVGKVDNLIGQEDRRSIAVDPGEKKTFEVQLRLPEMLPKTAIEVSMKLLVRENGREVLVQTNGEPVVRTVRMPVETGRSVTATRMDAPPKEQVYWRWPPTRTYSTYEMVVATRIDALLSRMMVGFEQEPFPVRLSDWECIDLLVLANPTAFDDAASIGMMQQHLQNGGRIWVMLDQIDTALVRDLLEEDQQLETVDTVQLNRVEIDVAGIDYDIADRTIDSDEPVRMKRVTQLGGQVAISANGWPVLITMQVGLGEVVFTTLDSSAWLQPRTTQGNASPSFQSTYKVPYWATTIPPKIHEPKPPSTLNLEKTSYAIEQIGNPIVSRWFVASILGSFSVFWVGLGLWRTMGGRVYHVGWIGPALALVASVPLLVASFLQRREIPPMVSVLQVAETNARAGTQVREAAAVYQSNSTAMELVGHRDGTAVPSEKVDSGIRTMITDDYQSWRMTNPVWPSGTWRYWSNFTLPEKTAIANSSLSEDGLIVELPKSNVPLEDIVVVMVPGAPVLGKRLDDQRILVRGDLPAEGDRWTADSIVNQEQLRRGAVYRELLENRKNPGTPSRTVCGWSRLLPESPQWSEQLERRGSTLTMMGVRVATPEVGATIRIPYNMIRIERDPANNFSVIFNQETGRFIEASILNANSDLDFVLPPEVVPLEVSSIDFDWDVRAPKRKAKLSCLVQGKMVTLAELNEPSLPFRGTIRSPEILQQMQDGRLVLHIEIAGDDASNSDQNIFESWQINYLRITVHGRTLPRNRLVSIPDR